jgi:hypothetical protein
MLMGANADWNGVGDFRAQQAQLLETTPCRMFAVMPRDPELLAVVSVA